MARLLLFLASNRRASRFVSLGTAGNSFAGSSFINCRIWSASGATSLTETLAIAFLNPSCGLLVAAGGLALHRRGRLSLTTVAGLGWPLAMAACIAAPRSSLTAATASPATCQYSLFVPQNLWAGRLAIHL